MHECLKQTHTHFFVSIYIRRYNSVLFNYIKGLQPCYRCGFPGGGGGGGRSLVISDDLWSACTTHGRALADGAIVRTPLVKNRVACPQVDGVTSGPRDAVRRLESFLYSQTRLTWYRRLLTEYCVKDKYKVRRGMNTAKASLIRTPLIRTIQYFRMFFSGLFFLFLILTKLIIQPNLNIRII